MFWGRNLLQHQQWNCRHSHLIVTSAIPLSFQVLYNLPVLSRQEQDRANLCPFPSLRTCLYHKIWWRSCSTAPTFAVLRIEEKNPTMIASLCSICTLASSTSYNELLIWSSFSNSLLLMAASVFSLVRYLVTVLQCVGSCPWYGSRRSCWLAPAAMTLGFGFLSPCLLASTADCTKLLKHFFGAYSTKRCIFVQTRHNCRWNNSRGVTIVSFRNMKLDINIFLAWDNNFSSSA